MLRGEISKNFVEGLNVIGAVVRRKGNACQDYFDVSGFEGCENGVEVFAGLVSGKAAKAVVAAKFNNDDVGVALNDGVYAGGSILCGGSAGTTILDLVFIAALIEVALECVGERLAGLEAVTRGDAVAEADDGGPVCCEQRK